MRKVEENNFGSESDKLFSQTVELIARYLLLFVCDSPTPGLISLTVCQLSILLAELREEYGDVRMLN